MVRPPLLTKGNKIGVIAPARKISHEEILLAVDVLKSWELEVIFGKNLFREQNQFSGSDEERVEDLQRMMDDDSVKAIISARGGYGTLRILDKINFSEFQKKTKWVIGFSDITALHSHIHNFGIETLHAPMLINFSKSAEATDSIRKVLFGEKIAYETTNHPLNRNGNAEGILAGGNLSLLYALSASKSDVDTTKKILFIEDVDEYLYHIDRMMLQIKRAGKLSHLSALIVGGMTDMKDNQIPFGKTTEEIIWDAVKEFSYPVCFNFPAGHIEKNLALPLGRRAKISVGSKVTLEF